MRKYYPIMLDICEKKCMVIGGGKVAERKVLSLLEYSGSVTVISPDLTAQLETLWKDGSIHVECRKYRDGDLQDAALVYVATNDQTTNRLCYSEARRRGILINVVDQPKLCEFIVPATVCRGDLTISVSTNGKSPMMAKKIREELEVSFGMEYEAYIEALGILRKMILEEVQDIEKRKNIFHQIVYSNLLDRYKNGEIDDIENEMIDLYRSFIIEEDGVERKN